jgi:hypothetical protein
MFEQAERWYGEHTRATYIYGTLAFLITGAIVGAIVLPADWSLIRQLAGGGIMGLWSGFCIFAWRFLFYGDD